MSLEDRLHAGELVDLENEPDREVPAELIAALLVRSPEPGAWNRPLRLQGARITGSLELDSATLTRPAAFNRCTFDKTVVLRETQALSLTFLDCTLPHLFAEDLVTRGDLAITGARVAEGITLLDARIGGMLDLDGATVGPDDGIAVLASRLSVGAEMRCGGGCDVRGQLRLIGARIAGDLYVIGGTLASSEDGPAICANGIQVGGLLSFESARITGETQLIGAHLGSLELSGGSFEQAGGDAIAASGLVVDGSTIGRDGLKISGHANFIGARFGVSFDLTGATVHNPGAIAITAERIRVQGNLHLRNGFQADGEIRLGGAHIAGQVDLGGATVGAVNGNSAVVESNVLCDDGFRAEGGFSLASARIGGDLEMRSAELRNPDGDLALDLEQITVAGTVWFGPRAFDGGLDLSGARVRAWHDSVDAWPDRLDINGFQYDSIDGMPVGQRLDWLQRNVDGYAPQPYHQLANVLRNHGQDREARQVLITSEQRRRSRRTGPIGWLAVAWSTFLRGSVGYGYRPWLVLAPWTVLLIIGSLLFDGAHRHGTLLPAHASGTQPGFQSVRYTLDLLLPVANLQLRGAFVATSTTAWFATGFMLAGWLLALTLVAAMTGVFKH